MSFWTNMSRLLILGAACATLPAMARGASQDISTQQEAAVQAAVARVAPSVVRIETVGGLERVGKLLVGEGPTTGLIVSPDGFILSSSFNFVQQPSSILVTLADGTRLPARRVATDHNRMVTLLKVEPTQDLPLPETAPLAGVRVGAWAIALGRTYEGTEPNVSVGIVSALDRIWGKAIQTDAKISPANYGGPLVDIAGRVQGILVPLSPDAGGPTAGADWYDSGIGFAVSLEQLQALLPRLKGGEDLRPGVIGVSLKGKNLYADPAELAIVRPNSPAYKAGLQPGDRIIEVAGRPIARQAQLKMQLNPRYAGEKVPVVAMRGNERIERELELVDKLLPYDRPFLGVLPMRDPVAAPLVESPPPAGQAETGATEEPVLVRYVYPDSPAAKAGLLAGDAIIAVAGEKLRGWEDLSNRLAAREVGASLKLKIRRGEQTLEPEAVLAALPTDVPATLPPASPTLSPLPDKPGPSVGRTAIKLPDFKNDCLVYVSKNYDDRLPSALVIWLHGPTGLHEDQLLANWQEPCDTQNLILMAPKAANGTRWTPPELEFIRKAADQVRATYAVDPRRVAAAGAELGGQIAYVVAFANPDLVRGVVAIDAPFGGRETETDPARPLAIYTATVQGGSNQAAVDRGLAQLRAMKFPVTVLELGEAARDLTAAERIDVVRWIDTLDRI